MKKYRVTYEGGFWTSYGRSGKEIPMKKEFFWGTEKWYIPAVYVCKEGLIVDFCKETKPEEMKAFIQKWNLLENQEQYSEEESEKIMQENPMSVDFEAQIILNGKELRADHSYGVSWIPRECLNDDVEPEMDAQKVLEHYEMDLSQAWTIRRCAFAWATKNKPVIKRLNLLMKRDPETIYGKRFMVPAAENEIRFEHPVTGKEHVLTVQEFEFQKISTPHFCETNMEYPECFAVMSYAVEPEIEGHGFMLRDTNPGDSPRMKEETSEECALNIIGGADGPTVVMCSSKRGACSSLYYEEQKYIEWRIEFHVKMMEDKVISVLL